MKAQSSDKLSRMTIVLPPDLAREVGTTLEEWEASGKVRRLWTRDASLWTGTDEGNWHGWLGIVDQQLKDLASLKEIAAEVKKEAFTHAIVLGMGGSSLCPDVLATTFGKQAGWPQLRVLDSTDPAEVRAAQAAVDVRRTLFVVSSKSGTTLEPNIFRDYFFDVATRALGAGRAGAHFVAVTDPGSQLEKESQRQRFRRIFHGVPSIGGRYSALSHFGMVPAAVMGLDVEKFLARAAEMVGACGADSSAEVNPGVVFGAILGVAAKHGRDKVTLIASPGIRDLSAWLEQLIAESTGKNGKGLIPVDREELGRPEMYGNDRLFAYLRLETVPDTRQDAAVDALEKAGHPVVRIGVRDAYDLSQEFFRWEMATAVASSILGVNAFNQPDVEASKIETRKLTSEYEKTGKLPEEQPVVVDGDIRLFTDAKNATALAQGAGGDNTLVGYLRSHLARIKAGDYFAVLAYIERNAAHESVLQQARMTVRDKSHVATCVEFGPRFLHSTGQAYKGGPNSGVFLQVTCDDAKDLQVPGKKFTFGVVKAAQARGDFEVLAQRGRRALRIHLGKDLETGLKKLNEAVKKALA